MTEVSRRIGLMAAMMLATGGYRDPMMHEPAQPRKEDNDGGDFVSPEDHRRMAKAQAKRERRRQRNFNMK